MGTFLFDQIIFGPVQSRRLGVSLGINLLPTDKKYCNYDCLYCECGWTCNEKVSHSDLPPRKEIKVSLENKIQDMIQKGQIPDTITFAGNGEPSMHPDFAGIIDDTVEIRNKYCPKARIAVLSNSTNLSKQKVVNALKKVDQAILKLDTTNNDSYRLINRPQNNSTINEIIDDLKKFGKGLIIQTLFFSGTFKNRIIDNTSEPELSGLFEAYKEISPDSIMIYTFERDTPLDSLKKISKEKLEEIAEKIRNLGFKVEVSA